MMSRLAFLLRLYAAFLATFVVQKPLFMLLDAPEGSDYSLGDGLRVISEGLLLDVPMSGYLIILPFLFALGSCWARGDIALRRVFSPYYALLAVVIALVFVGDLSLYPFWKFKLDATIFIYMDSPKEMFASVSVGYVALRLAVIIILAALLFICFRKATPKTLRPIRLTKERVGGSVLLVLLMAPLAISIRGGLGESTANIGKVYFSDDEFLNHSAVNPAFSLLYSLGKAENYADEFNYFDEEKRKSLFAGLYPETPADTIKLLNTTRPNIIIILMEGFGGQFVEAVSGRKDIAPNYNRLSREGVIFTRCYSNSYRTDRGMVAALSGYPAFPTLSVMKLPIKSRTLPCIAASLNANGYHSSFVYGGDINFTNMQSYLRTGGYATIVSDKDFTAEEKEMNPWGANDDATFHRLYEMAVAESREPWHIGYLTLSSHEPFEVPYNRLKEKIPNAFAFTDHCLGQFVERMRRTEAWKNLLIVCIPDHGFVYPGGITHEQHHHNSMLWIGGAVSQPRVISTMMSQSDLPATLLGQLQMPHSAYTFSRDALSPQYTYPFAFFTYSDGLGLADSAGCTIYDIHADKISYNRDAPGTSGGSTPSLRADRAKAIMQTLYDDLGAR